MVGLSRTSTRTVRPPLPFAYRCIGGARVCVPGFGCTPCFGGTLQCFDQCVPPGGANTILGNTLAAARSLAQSSIDHFATLSSNTQDIIAEEIRALPPPLQNLLMNATRFANASIGELRQIGQDVLANVRYVRLVHIENQVECGLAGLRVLSVGNLDGNLVKRGRVGFHMRACVHAHVRAFTCECALGRASIFWGYSTR
jgi:hypothetical protein